MSQPAVYTHDGTDADLDALIARVRLKLRRVIATINGKGGQGKTTLVANLAGLLAEALVAARSTKRVLAIDFDPQGNLGLDLAYQGTPGDDQGAGMVAALMSGTRPTPLRDVRPQLDVIPGGDRLFDIPGLMLSRGMRDQSGRTRLALAVVLAQLADDYDWILIDCPPLEILLQDLALVAAQQALIPVHFDEASRQGMGGVSKRFTAVGDLNPELDLLGVVMFGFKYQAGGRKADDGEDGELREIGQRARVRKQLLEDLAAVGSDAPVFNTVIRDLPSVAESCRKRGQLVFELENVTDGPKWWEIRAGKATGQVIPTGQAAKLADEYQQLAAEVFGRAIELEQQEVA